MAKFLKLFWFPILAAIVVTFLLLNSGKAESAPVDTQTISTECGELYKLSICDMGDGYICYLANNGTLALFCREE